MVVPYTGYEGGSDSDEDDYDSDEDDELRWIKDRKVAIMTPDGEEVGSISLQIIRRQSILDEGESFYMVMDERSHDLMNLACLFTARDARLKPEVQTAGTGVWRAAEFARDENMAYVEEIVIKDSWRGKGVGTWALSSLFHLDLLRDADVHFLWAWPTILNHLEPRRSDPSVPLAPSEIEALDAKKERIVSFFRKIGFRRVGTGSFFCLAKNPRHRSRAVPVSGDAPWVEGEVPGSTDDMMKEILGLPL
ncbi:hypothetical protein BV25DRAFT_1920971 [Artomyces pyxidatus]|uniref:Uncharacterized protein n=1 Tax=Artomyces pyxidatus TaxID=48021 RepID=A0ACB8SKN5_9AGAM|nr:hypothetical protein BV25DRAFT_1920971 [Artomyces pyxidatus]